jgi:anion transporter
MAEHPHAEPAEGAAPAFGSPRTWIPLIAAGLALLAGLTLPPPDGLPPIAARTLGVLGFAIILWASNAINPTLVALIVMALWPLLGVMSFADAAGGFHSDAVWLMLSILLVSVAFVASGLDRRVVYRLLYLANGRTRATMLWVVLALLLLTALVPTAAGRAGIMLAIGQGMMRAINLPRGSNVGKALFMLVAYVNLFSSNALLTGALVELYAASVFQELLGHTWTFLSWMVVNAPPAVLSALLVLVLMLRLYPPELEVLEGGRAYLRERISELGPVRPAEQKLGLVIGLMLLGWMTEPWHGIETHMVGLLAMLLAFLPPYAATSLDDALKRMPLNVILLFGSSLPLTVALQRSQLPAWMAAQVGQLPLGGLPLPAIGLVFMLLSLVMRLGFPNAVALAATFLPITFATAQALGINPVWLGMLALIPTQLPLLPMVSPGVSILFSGGYFEVSDMFKAGLAISAIVLSVTLAMALMYWPLVGLVP